MIVNLAPKALHVTKQESATTKTTIVHQVITAKQVLTRSRHVSQVPSDLLRVRPPSDRSATPIVTDKLHASYVQPASTAQTRLNLSPNCAGLELTAPLEVVSRSFATQVTTVSLAQVSKLSALQASSARVERKESGSASSVLIAQLNHELNSHALVAHMDQVIPITLIKNLPVLHVDEAFSLCRMVMRLLNKDVKIARQVTFALVEQAQKRLVVRDATVVTSAPWDITAQWVHLSPYLAQLVSTLST